MGSDGLKGVQDDVWISGLATFSKTGNTGVKEVGS